MSKSKSYWHEYVGFNFRMTNIQAAIGVAQIERIQELLKRRQEIFENYNRKFKKIENLYHKKYKHTLIKKKIAVLGSYTNKYIADILRLHLYYYNYLINYSWPGNVRELRNLIERIAILSPGSNDEKILSIVKESMKPQEENFFDIKDTLAVPLKIARENFEKEYLTTQLKKFGGNISKMAKFIGMERSALHRKLKTLGVKGLN